MLQAVNQPQIIVDPSKVGPSYEQTEVRPVIEPTKFEMEVNSILSDIGKMLIEKNQSYGDSALDPVRVFSKADTMEQLKVRIDDKLSRIMRGHEYQDESAVEDLLGYLVLYIIQYRRMRPYAL